MHRIKYIHKTDSHKSAPMQANAGRSTVVSVGSLSGLGGESTRGGHVAHVVAGVTYWYLLVAVSVLYCVFEYLTVDCVG